MGNRVGEKGWGEGKRSGGGMGGVRRGRRRKGGGRKLSRCPST